MPEFSVYANASFYLVTSAWSMPEDLVARHRLVFKVPRESVKDRVIGLAVENFQPPVFWKQGSDESIFQQYNRKYPQINNLNKEVIKHRPPHRHKNESFFV